VSEWVLVSVKKDGGLVFHNLNGCIRTINLNKQISISQHWHQNTSRQIPHTIYQIIAVVLRVLGRGLAISTEQERVHLNIGSGTMYNCFWRTISVLAGDLLIKRYIKWPRLQERVEQRINSDEM
jgi:hypothetical protein